MQQPSRWWPAAPSDPPLSAEEGPLAPASRGRLPTPTARAPGGHRVGDTGSDCVPATPAPLASQAGPASPRCLGGPWGRGLPPTPAATPNPSRYSLWPVGTEEGGLGPSMPKGLQCRWQLCRCLRLCSSGIQACRRAVGRGPKGRCPICLANRSWEGDTATPPLTGDCQAEARRREGGPPPPPSCSSPGAFPDAIPPRQTEPSDDPHPSSAQAAVPQRPNREPPTRMFSGPTPGFKASVGFAQGEGSDPPPSH